MLVHAFSSKKMVLALRNRPRNMLALHLHVEVSNVVFLLNVSLHAHKCSEVSESFRQSPIHKLDRILIKSSSPCHHSYICIDIAVPSTLFVDWVENIPLKVLAIPLTPSSFLCDSPNT